MLNFSFGSRPANNGGRELEIRCGNLFQRAIVPATASYSDVARWECWATRQVYWIANNMPDKMGAFDHPAIQPALVRLCKMLERDSPESRLLGHAILDLEGHKSLAIRIGNLQGGRQFIATQWGNEVIGLMYPYRDDLDVCW